MLLERYLKAMRNFLLYFILVIFLCPQVFSKEIFEIPNDTLLVGDIDFVKTQFCFVTKSLFEMHLFKNRILHITFKS